MRLEDISLLIEVARHGSFAEVARLRGMDPSTVSRAVSAIEQSLGFRVFQRTTRRVELTEAGDLFLRRLSAITEEIDAARDEALALAHGPQGTLRITTTVAFGDAVFVPLLPRFCAAFPGIGLDLVLSDTNLNLVADRIDLAIRLGPEVVGDVVATRLHKTRYRVCASPAYLASVDAIASPADIAHLDCLRFALTGFRDAWHFRDRDGRIESINVAGPITASGALALRALAIAGVGPALLGNWLIDDDLAKGTLVDLFPEHQVTATTFDTAVWAVYPSRSFLPQKVRVMIDFLRDEARTCWSRWR
ncbi:MAG: LysR family transcriptional regulator [Pseudomonadota bacterium]